MDKTLVEYKCPCCSGAISFDSELQRLACPYCKTEFEVDAVKDFNEAEKERERASDPLWDEYASGNTDWKEGEELNVYICSACAGEIVTDSTTSATLCPYCGSPVIVSGKLSGAFRPDYVIPFKVSKDGAKKALQDFLKKKPLLPKDFKSLHSVDKIEGVYVPFWLYDCNTSSHIRYRATRTHVWMDSNFTYTKTSHFLLTRAGRLSFERVPADGSSKMDDIYMEAIEPFDYGEMVDFEMPYLAGFSAEKYDVDPKMASYHANERIKVSTQCQFDSTTAGYATVTPQSTNIDLINGKTKYALMPVWILNTSYKGKKYTFAMNGQTGKVVGELPISTKKSIGWFGAVAGGIALVGTIISVLLAFF